MLFSIIIPAFNVEKFISNTLDCVISQTFHNFECIVINDGSTDYTESLVSEYCNRDNRIKIVSQKNAGVSVARNKGISIANGEYLCFMDADDKIYPNHLEIISEIIDRKHPDIIQTGFEIINNGIITKRIMPNLTDGKICDFFLHNEACAASLWTKIIKRSLCIDNNVFCPEGIIMNEDLYMSFLLFFYAKSIEFAKNTYYQYIQVETSCTKNHTQRHIDSMLSVINKLRVFSNYNKIEGINDFLFHRNIMVYSLYVTDTYLYDMKVFKKNVTLSDLKKDKHNISKIIYIYLRLCFLLPSGFCYILCKIQPYFRKLLRY